ncbi:hypothetical protein L1987_63965 [Smallanthus sonchifolius]|uniref:Uncharacterized protein n=1 Tax=Smallanthus sonchifolius TaxID=185202 RepID=A0ACB9CER3_9ASTR|nr:hypothetical protein L1987_63965 [Smallanthus sonchifolius]
MERPRGLCRSAVREGKRRVSCCRNSGSSDRLRMVVNGGSMMLHNDGIKLRSNDGGGVGSHASGDSHAGSRGR